MEFKPWLPADVEQFRELLKCVKNKGRRRSSKGQGDCRMECHRLHNCENTRELKGG